MNHRARPQFPAGKDSVLLLSSAEAKHVLVFIHGFGGQATGTWSGFEAIVDDASAWDIIFYGYSSWAGQANSHAEAFRVFLNSLLTAPSQADIAHRRYEKALIVAHSLGAVITRRALLNAVLRDDPFVSKVSFVLFAPAHQGATNITDFYSTVLEALPEGILGPVRQVPLVGAVVDQVAAVVSSAAKVTVAKSLRDLTPGSLTLAQIASETSTLLQRRPELRNALVARRIVFGDGEDIVDTNRFCDDPVSEYYSPKNNLSSRWIPGADHLAICKPSRDFLAPLSIVAAELRALDASECQSDSSKVVAQTVHELLVPDPLGRLACLEHFFDQDPDAETVEVTFRDHRGNAVKDVAQILVRDGLDILLDRISVLELAARATYHRVLTPVDEIHMQILQHPKVKPYYIVHYPAPLVQAYLARVATGEGLTDDAQGRLGVKAFLRFSTIQSSFASSQSMQKFRRLLEDFILSDPSQPDGWLSWRDLQQMILVGVPFKEALISSEHTDSVLAAQGYRAFLLFLFDLYDCAQSYDKCRQFVSGLLTFYGYWIELFRLKFSATLEAALQRFDLTAQELSSEGQRELPREAASLIVLRSIFAVSATVNASWDARTGPGKDLIYN